jgi:hypothetical protein
MDQKLIDYSRVVAVMGQQDVLSHEMAQHFCQAILPHLLSELDVLTRLADAKFASVLDVPVQPAPEPVEKDTKKRPAKQAKKAKRTKARKPKHERSDA